MLGFGAMLGAVSLDATTLDTVFNSASVYTNTNKTARDITGRIVRSVASISAPVYFEVRIDNMDGAGSVGIGVTNSGPPYNATYGANAKIWVYDSTGISIRNVSGSPQSGRSLPSCTTSDVVLVAVNGNSIWFGKNGTWPSSDPAAGTNPVYTDLDTSGLYAVGGFFGGGSNTQLTFRFSPNEWSYAAPSGFGQISA